MREIVNTCCRIDVDFCVVDEREMTIMETNVESAVMAKVTRGMREAGIPMRAKVNGHKNFFDVSVNENGKVKQTTKSHIEITSVADSVEDDEIAIWKNVMNGIAESIKNNGLSIL